MGVGTLQSAWSSSPLGFHMAASWLPVSMWLVCLSLRFLLSCSLTSKASLTSLVRIAHQLFLASPSAFTLGFTYLLIYAVPPSYSAIFLRATIVVSVVYSYILRAWKTPWYRYSLVFSQWINETYFCSTVEIQWDQGPAGYSSLPVFIKRVSLDVAIHQCFTCSCFCTVMT